MEKSWFLVLLFLQVTKAQVVFGVGGTMGGGGVSAGGNMGGVGGVGGVGVSVGGNMGGGGGGEGINAQSPPGSSNSGLSSAYIALQAWKSEITDDPSGVLNTWVGSNVCSYKGVYCADPQEEMSTPQGPVVAGIDLNLANLQGSLVKELSLLTDLTFIHLNSNRFSGIVPDTLRYLSSLRELDLSNNHFSGPFPTVTLFLQNLIYLDLRYNNFSGPISEDLFNNNLDAIFLNNNQFDGQIPQNLGNSQASVINLANNKFNGNIPASFGYVGPTLKEVLFLNNQLTGCIPEGVGLLTGMEVLDVSFNSLMGHLPDSISCLNGIEVLNLAHNKLSGVVPDLVCSLKSLINLTVSYNFFSGFSEECTKLFFRNVGFDFSANCIPGRDMQRPQPQCSMIPGGGLSCLRIPSTRPFVCNSMEQTPDANPGSSSYLLAPSTSPP